MQNLKSLAVLSIAIMIFGTLGIYRKFLTLTSASIAFYRGIIGVLFLIFIMKIRRENVKKIFALAFKNFKTFFILFISGVCLGLNWLFLFEGYNYAYVSLVSLCCYMQPIFVIIMSAIFFHEKITLRKFLCFLAALIGMFLISGVIEAGMPDKNAVKGMIYGLCSGFFYAIVTILNKFVRGVDPYSKTIIQLIASSLAMLPYLIFTNGFAGDIWNLKSVILLIMVGVINTGTAYALYFGSMEGLKAQTVALFGYIDPVTALILAAVILGERLTIWGIAGAVLILGAAAVCELKN